MRDKIAELKEMVRDGIITSDIAEQAIAKIQEKDNYGKRNHDANNNCAYKKK